MLDRILWLYFFVTPWFYVGSSGADLRLTFVDAMLPIGLGLLLWVRPTRTPWWLKAGLLLAPWALLSTLQNIAEPKFLSYLLKALRLAGVFMPALLCCRLKLDDSSLSRLSRAFAWGGFISVAVGIAGFVLDWEWTRAIQTYDYGEGRLTGRAGGIFRDSGAYGHMVATWMAFFFALTWPGLGKLRWIIGAGVTFTGAVAIYASMSRAAMLDILVMAVVQALALLVKGRRLRYYVAGFGLVLVVVVVLNVGLEENFSGQTENRAVQIFVKRFSTIAQGLSSDTDQINALTGNRLKSWIRCLDVWLEHPLLGVGYKAAIPQYGIVPDNVYVMALLETGGLGFLLLGGLLFGVWLWLIRSAWSGSRVGLAMAIAWSGQLAHGLSADILTFPASISLAAAFAALVWRSEASHATSIRSLPLRSRSLAGLRTLQFGRSA